MTNLKFKMKVILTNWIIVSTVLLSGYIYSVISNLLLPLSTINSAFFNAFGTFVYDIVMYGGIIVGVVIMDLFFIGKNVKKIQTNLYIEWGIISAPLIFFAVKYGHWISLVLVIVFFIGQLIRKSMISRIINEQRAYPPP